MNSDLKVHLLAAQTMLSFIVSSQTSAGHIFNICNLMLYKKKQHHNSINSDWVIDNCQWYFYQLLPCRQSLIYKCRFLVFCTYLFGIQLDWDANLIDLNLLDPEEKFSDFILVVFGWKWVKSLDEKVLRCSIFSILFHFFPQPSLDADVMSKWHCVGAAFFLQTHPDDINVVFQHHRWMKKTSCSSTLTFNALPPLSFPILKMKRAISVK